MGYRQAAVLAADCFCLGVLCICLNVDYRILFTPLTDAVVRDGFEFYTMFYNAPSGIKAMLHAVIGLGIVGLVGKVNKWDESALFFDGTSLAAWIFAVAIYIAVGIPAVRTVADPLDVDSRADQVEALRVLSAGNTIILVLLGGILVLQAGEAYARRVDERARAAALAAVDPVAEKILAEAAEESKKDK